MLAPGICVSNDDVLGLCVMSVLIIFSLFRLLFLLFYYFYVLFARIVIVICLSSICYKRLGLPWCPVVTLYFLLVLFLCVLFLC